MRTVEAHIGHLNLIADACSGVLFLLFPTGLPMHAEAAQAALLTVWGSALCGLRGPIVVLFSSTEKRTR